MLGMKSGKPAVPVFSTTAISGQGVGELALWLEGSAAGRANALAA
jgi:hypothetical protein